jgi:hypothetical protein
VIWQEQAAASHYQTAVAVAKEIAAGNTAEGAAGLDELIDAVARSERRALRSHLVRLMAHIIKWKNQPARRSGSWAVTILQVREEIAAIQEEVPSLTRETILDLWQHCSDAALQQAEAEMGQAGSEMDLSWDEVFNVTYKTISLG